MPKPKPKPKPRPKPKPSTYRVPIVCAFIALALLSFRAPPARTGDFTCINPNAIRSFSFSGTAGSYTTSATKNFMITDVIGVGTAGPSLVLRGNGQNLLIVPKRLIEFNVGGPGGTMYASYFDSVNLVSGIPVGPGTVITELSGLAVTVCGYEF